MAAPQVFTTQGSPSTALQLVHARRPQTCKAPGLRLTLRLPPRTSRHCMPKCNTVWNTLQVMAPPRSSSTRMGWFLEPQYSLDLGALRTLWRKTTTPEAWTEDLPLAELREGALRLLPQAAQVLRRLGWWLVQGDNLLCSRDPDDAVRRLRIGRESFEGVIYWLQLHYRKLYLQ